ncbi:NAD(P)-dependent oxidoreductase [Lacticaseibacillus camelliae]|uniref:NAD-dependent epimerase dehydratase n=1 Tax=Lacticaseibacillus camelliae DSM 22697 = JCM 13995 TaxID=1423730 RepID=A0A0R2FKA9_9LACO|nr:NAD(P)H-binding protein [Lacticaseibacillus camelliae]KRN25068.1 NAD-dependent epimerase dehydratase [Lacticaseibacillus camelliae DSM 22697 = JCM 13995]
MRIGIIGATGHVGQEMVKAALAKDHEVTAIVRNRAKVEKLFGSKVTVLAKDALTLDRVDLDGLDAVVDAFASPNAFQHLDLATRLISMFRETERPYLLFVLGASSLRLASGELMLTQVEKQAAGAPWVATPEQQVHEYQYLQWIKDVAWTAISPQATLTDGPLGDYRLGTDQVMTAPSGKSEVSAANLAAAAIAELEAKTHMRQRFTVVNA